MLLGRLPSRIASSSHSFKLSLARCITHTAHCRAMSSADSGSNTVLTDRQGGVALLTMNRERALNALSLEMCTSMHDALKQWLPDPSLRCLILKGAGTKAFCAGGDVKSIATEQGPFTPGQPGTLRCDFFREEYKLDWALARAKAVGSKTEEPGHVSQVSIWNGIVMGGGVGVSIHGSFRVATETTLWAMPETAIGLFPDVGASFVLARLPGGLGAYIALLGARLRACDLLYAGLATHCVAADRRVAAARLGVRVRVRVSASRAFSLGAPCTERPRLSHEVEGDSQTSDSSCGMTCRLWAARLMGWVQGSRAPSTS
eukprot:TRINITY_DN11502_c1_g1_i4.p1 TRINITY_DN11502_c1_g1~~TRINITY_DN11502_c1_g1_i4.p1  ORF type:complete len:316 (+),score=26.14 TRINITY_DN11502_c1_g1_i4:170-1117(+)